MQKPTSGYGTYPPSKQLFGAASKRANGEIPYNYLSYNPRHIVTDKDRQECFWGCLYGWLIFLVLAIIGLIIAIVVLTTTKSSPNIQPVHEIDFLESDLLGWNSSLSTVPCCTVYSSRALCIGLSLGARSFCNAVMPACIPPDANGAAQQLPNFITSTGVVLPTFTVQGAFYGNRSYVSSYDSGNTFGLPYAWISLPILINDVITITNAAELYYFLFLDNIDTEIPIVQNGILASDGLVMNCQNTVPNFRVLTLEENNPAQIELD